ncbi:DUF6172 family protein [Kiritimatiellota bacterium B12222]|nr:DUF6172 family protein [Kiritimatiellota bacterium B12222]
MKKNFSLTDAGKHKNIERHLDAVKNELRKYLRRENKRALADEFDYWDFDCRFGETDASAEAIVPGDVIKCVDKAKVAGWDSFYMEILSRPAKRPNYVIPKTDPESKPEEDA